MTQLSRRLFAAHWLQWKHLPALHLLALQPTETQLYLCVKSEATQRQRLVLCTIAPVAGPATKPVLFRGLAANSPALTAPVGGTPAAIASTDVADGPASNSPAAASGRAAANGPAAASKLSDLSMPPEEEKSSCEEEEEESGAELFIDDDLSSWGSDEEIWGSGSDYYGTDEEEEALAGQQSGLCQYQADCACCYCCACHACCG